MKIKELEKCTLKTDLTIDKKGKKRYPNSYIRNQQLLDIQRVSQKLDISIEMSTLVYINTISPFINTLSRTKLSLNKPITDILNTLPWESLNDRNKSIYIHKATELISSPCITFSLNFSEELLLSYYSQSENLKRFIAKLLRYRLAKAFGYIPEFYFSIEVTNILSKECNKGKGRSDGEIGRVHLHGAIALPEEDRQKFKSLVLSSFHPKSSKPFWKKRYMTQMSYKSSKANIVNWGEYCCKDLSFTKIQFGIESPFYATNKLRSKAKVLFEKDRNLINRAIVNHKRIALKL